MAVNVAEKTKLGEWEFRIEGMTPRHLGNHIRRSPISEASYCYLCGHAVIDESSSMLWSDSERGRPPSNVETP